MFSSRRSSMSVRLGPPAVMTIAGSDSSGGAGIQADLKTFTVLQCYGTSIITALTAQNTMGVFAVHPTPPEFIGSQLQAVLSDMDIAAIKTGMLYDAANTRAVVSSLKAFYSQKTFPPLVVDPVCVSTSGHTLLERSALEVMINELLPLATLVTPNKSEAELLLSLNTTQRSINSIVDALTAARDLSSLSHSNILLKGGHLNVSGGDVEALLTDGNNINLVWDSIRSENMEILQTTSIRDKRLVVDILYERDNSSFTVLARPHIESTSTHGTGCTLSAAIASYLARGQPIVEAVKLAINYTHDGIQAAYPLGNGHGPLNHVHASLPRLIPLPTSTDPYPFTRTLIRSNAHVWKQYVEHPFVRQLGEGTLRRECFLHFIKQDYQYLKYYSRAYGLLITKSQRFNAIKSASDTIQNVIHEVSMHKAYCASWGIDEFELETAPESPATTAYGAYLLDSGLQGDETKLIVTLAACLLGYGEVGLWLKAEAVKENSWVKWETNPYLKWIEDYSGHKYQNAVRLGLDILEEAAKEDPPSQKRLDEWIAVWKRCTLLEKGFWDMAMNLS